MTDADILNLAEDCGLMVEIEELESWEGMFAVDKEGLQKFARRVEAEAQSCAEPVGWTNKEFFSQPENEQDNRTMAVWKRKMRGKCEIPLYAAPQPIAAAQPTHLVRRGLRPDGTYPPADDDESVAATPETDAVWLVFDYDYTKLLELSRKLERERNEARAALETTQATMLRLKRETDEMSLRAITAETALEVERKWHNAALSAGESFAGTGPDRYYNFDAVTWIAWARNRIEAVEARVRELEGKHD